MNNAVVAIGGAAPHATLSVRPKVENPEPLGGGGPGFLSLCSY
jgi:hypothetical protein